jgi:hypothetical protein
MAELLSYFVFALPVAAAMHVWTVTGSSQDASIEPLGTRATSSHRLDGGSKIIGERGSLVLDESEGEERGRGLESVWIPGND